MIITFSGQLDENWRSYVTLTFDLLTKLLICLLHVLIIKLCWKFDKKKKARMIIKFSGQLDENWRSCVALTFDLWTKLLIWLLHVLIIKLCWQFDDKSSNGKKKVTAPTDTHPQTHRSDCKTPSSAACKRKSHSKITQTPVTGILFIPLLIL